MESNLLAKFLRKIDFVGPEVQLRTFGDVRFKTIFGGIISSVVFGLVLIIGLYFSKILVYRGFIWIVENKDLNPNPVLHEASGIVAMTIINEKGEQMADRGDIVKITAAYVEDNSSSYIPSNVEYSSVELEKCSDQATLAKHEAKLGTSLGMDDFLCIKNENLSIHGHPFSNQNHSYISFNISSCSNSTGHHNCISSNLIENTLNKAYIIIRYLDNDVNNFNSTSARYSYIRDDVIPVITRQAMIYTYFYQNVLYDTDYNWFYFEATEEHFFKMEKRVDTIPRKIEDKNNLAEINFKMSVQMLHYLRNYYKFQDALANIGGIMEAVLFISHIIQNYVTTRINSLSIANEIISFSDNIVNPGQSPCKSPRKTCTFYEKQNSHLNNFVLEREDIKNKSQIRLTSQEKIISEMSNNQIQIDKGQHLSQMDHQPKAPGMIIKERVNNHSSASNNTSKGESLKKRKLNLFHHVEKTKNQRMKIGSETQNIELALKEFLCDRLCFQKTKNINLLEKAQKYINEKISIEFVLKKLNEVDKLKFVLFNKDQLNLFHCIPNPNFNEIFSDRTEKGHLNVINTLWRKYEFYQPDLEEENQSLYILKSSNEIDATSSRLLAYVNITKADD